MRLLFLSNVFPSPLHPTKGTFNCGLVRALMQLGHDVSVVAPIAWTDRIRAPRSRGLELRRQTGTWQGISVRYPLYFYTPGVLRSAYGSFMWRGIRPDVLRVLDQQHPHAVVSYWTHPDGECGVRAARHAGIPAVTMVGGSDVLMLASDSWRRRAIYDVLKDSDAVVAVSQDLRRTMVAGGIDGRKVHVVRRGIDIQRFCPGDRQEARRRLNLPGDRPILLWVGRMEAVKGLSNLLAAIESLQKAGLVFETVLIGTGGQMGAIAAEVKRRGLSQRVRMPGAVPHDKLPDYYRAADLTVLPSISEGVPNVLLESIASGTPFVASAVGGIPEIASPDIDHLVPPADPGALATAIRDQLSTPKPTAERTFTPEDWPTAAQRLVDVIQLLIDKASQQQTEGTPACLKPSIA